MIGVLADSSDYAAVREFFELFKTPWEFYRDEGRYDVLLCAGDHRFETKAARLVLIYGGRGLPCDAGDALAPLCREEHGRMLAYRQERIPIYAESVSYPDRTSAFLWDAGSRHVVGQVQRSGERVTARIGYDLFREIGILLTQGQPACSAAIPALDLHIAVLRDLMITSGSGLREIPPVPEGYRFIACLTHDVDHPSIRLHKCDHTMFGFLYRALFNSIFRLAAKRLTARQFLANWIGAAKLPFVYLGLAGDIWRDFDRYPEIEGRPRSSFFVIPFKGRPGQSDHGPAPKSRASGYGAADIASQIQALKASGSEIGLHGIDAWRDAAKAREELEEIRRLSGMQAIGVRMHWLYFDRHSPAILEEAGADYDSTAGYNETIGYWAGTSQAYKPLDAVRLLELPLQIMDTALFYPNRANLSPREARKRVGHMIDNAVRFGGALTINWHDRSIAPERCWGDFYQDVVAELRDKGAWFATAAETVAWFRKRRAAAFDGVDGDPRVKNAAGGGLPGLQLIDESRRLVCNSLGSPQTAII